LRWIAELRVIERPEDGPKFQIGILPQSAHHGMLLDRNIPIELAGTNTVLKYGR
jgi:hypothetical protein